MTQVIWLCLLLAAAAYGWSAWRRQSLFSWVAQGLLTLALVAVLLTSTTTGLATAVLSVWAAGAALLFVTRFSTDGPRLLAILPLAAVVLLVGLASLPGAFGQRTVHDTSVPAITWVHIAFMTGFCAAAFVAGGSSAAFLVVNRQLKRDPLQALAGPALPRLTALVHGSLIVAAAFLVGGLATGGAALGVSETVSLWSPLPVIGMISMALLAPVLAMHQASRLGRFGLIGSAFVIAILATLSLLVVVVRGAHG